MMSAAVSPASDRNAARHPNAAMMKKIAIGISDCPARWPTPRIAMTRPRRRRNQFASATPVPTWMPASADPRPAPNASQNCHGSCIHDNPSIASAMITPAATTTIRAPYWSSRRPVSACITDPVMLPMVKASEIVARLHPSSSSIDVKNTPSTGPNIGAIPNAATVDAHTTAHP